MSDWWDRAECAGVEDNTIFFPELVRGDFGSHHYDRAREFCNVCPVRAECLEFQMEFEEETGRRDGMFGGLTPRERDQLFQKRIRNG